MLQSNEQYSNYGQDDTNRILLQLLLFIDKRSSSDEQIQKIQQYLRNLQSDYSFKLSVIEIDKQPHLVEYLKLVATPALVKISPAPKQTLAGSNLIDQLEQWWPRWQVAQEESKANTSLENYSTNIDCETYNADKIRLSDEIFCLPVGRRCRFR